MMVAMRWEPFKELVNLQERLNKLFREAFPRTQEEATSVWTPPVDVFEKEDEIVLKVEIPEVDQNEIELKVEDNTLTIQGERKLEEGTTKEDYYRMERYYGKFSRSFSLPNTVDQNKIKATYKDGVLRIVLPKREETRPKQIKIEVE